jgi:hypothetical protein
MTRYQLHKLASFIRKEIVKIGAFNSYDLACGCAVSAVTIHQTLKALGQRSYVVEWTDETKSEGHCWCVSNGYVIDITAKQFNPRLDAVIVIRYYDYLELKDFIDIDKGTTVKGLQALRSIFSDEWCDEQNPHTYEKEINKIIKKCVKMFNNN